MRWVIIQSEAIRNMLPPTSDVLVVGAGNAAFCAALAAAEHGVSVLILERASEEKSGGNSQFTAGAFRCVYDGVADLKALMPDLTDEEIANADFGTYTEEKFFDDMGRVTEYRTDPDLCELLSHPQQEHNAVDAGKGHPQPFRSTAGRPTRSTASSSSGAASPWNHGAAALVLSILTPQLPRRQ